MYGPCPRPRGEIGDPEVVVLPSTKDHSEALTGWGGHRVGAMLSLGAPGLASPGGNITAALGEGIRW